MSVLIKGMEMPENCRDCRIACERYLSVNGLLSKICLDDMVHPDCQLIELPPHGRLIDADALVKSIKDQIELIKQFHNDDLDMVAQMIEVGYVQEIANAPTILEAEVD